MACLYLRLYLKLGISHPDNIYMYTVLGYIICCCMYKQLFFYFKQLSVPFCSRSWDEWKTICLGASHGRGWLPWAQHHRRRADYSVIRRNMQSTVPGYSERRTFLVLKKMNRKCRTFADCSRLRVDLPFYVMHYS